MTLEQKQIAMKERNAGIIPYTQIVSRTIAKNGAQTVKTNDATSLRNCTQHPGADKYKSGQCGECMRQLRRRSYDINGASPRTKYGECRGQAERRGLAFELTFEEWQEIVSLPCVYALPGDSGHKIGIDRANNNEGYTYNNSRPCCMRHNGIKSNIFTFEQMLDLSHRYKVHCGDRNSGRKKQAVRAPDRDVRLFGEPETLLPEITTATQELSCAE